MRKPTEYLALFFLLLVVGVYWGPWLGLHRSLALFSLPELVHLAQILATNLGGSMGIILPACIVSMVAAAWLYPAKENGRVLPDPAVDWVCAGLVRHFGEY